MVTSVVYRRHLTRILLLGTMVDFMVRLSAQEIAVKTNGLYWLTTTLNAGVEFATSNKVTIELNAAYNPWTFKDDKKMRFWLAQPELKYW